MKNIYKRFFLFCSKVITVFLIVFPVAVDAQESMRANLFVVDAGGTILVDGNLTNYSDIYSNTVDINDGWKMTNPGINFGILREGYNLVVERRSIIRASDTTFFRMWNLPQNHYQVKFMLTKLDHRGLKAFIKDKYLNTETPVKLNDTTYYDFSIDANTGSADQMRFQLIYGPVFSGPAEVNFTGIKATRKEKDVMLEWSLTKEIYLNSYTIQHSPDGNDFHDIYQYAPGNNPVSETYTYTDTEALAGDNFYRIKVFNMAGQVQYSTVAKVSALGTIPSINVYPNPIANKTIQLQFNNLPDGKYSISVVNNNGISQQLPALQLEPGQSTKSVLLPQKLAPGIYNLLFIGPGNSRITKVIVVL